MKPAFRRLSRMARLPAYCKSRRRERKTRVQKNMTHYIHVPSQPTRAEGMLVTWMDVAASIAFAFLFPLALHVTITWIYGV